MSAKAARDNFTDVLGTVYYGKTPVAVEKKGRVFAVVIHPDEYANLKKMAKQRFFEIVNDIQKANTDADPDEVMKDATAAVEEVRGQQYEQSR